MTIRGIAVHPDNLSYEDKRTALAAQAVEIWISPPPARSTHGQLLNGNGTPFQYDWTQLPPVHSMRATAIRPSPWR
jgi:hypothetical protein